MQVPACEKATACDDSWHAYMSVRVSFVNFQPRPALPPSLALQPMGRVSTLSQDLLSLSLSFSNLWVLCQLSAKTCQDSPCCCDNTCRTNTAAERLPCCVGLCQGTSQPTTEPPTTTPPPLNEERASFPGSSSSGGFDAVPVIAGQRGLLRVCGGEPVGPSGERRSWRASGVA